MKHDRIIYIIRYTQDEYLAATIKPVSDNSLDRDKSNRPQTATHADARRQ